MKNKFSREFKLQVLRELDSGKSRAQVCREFDIYSNLLTRWKKEYEANPDQAFSGRGNPSTVDTKVDQLERVIGQLYLENSFLKKAVNSLQKRLAETKKGA